MALSGLFTAITPAANGIPRADGTGLIDLGWVFAAKGANTVFAGPVSGADADPAFRALVAGDIPDLSSIYVPVTRQINTGTGLSGGGALSSDLTLAVTGNLATLFSLADGAGWLHNDGAGALAYSTPTPADIGLSAGNSITLTGGVIDTIQNIRTTASPTFGGIIISTNNVMIPGGTITGLTQLGIATGSFANIQNINESSIDGLSYVSVNYKGYLNGTTQPRGLRVYDGKTNLISQTDSSGLTIIPSTASTSPTTGALVVGGGVGVGGAVIANSYIKTVGYVVSALPSAATAGAGAITLVTNATNAAGTDLGVIPTGGGSVNRMVYSDGSNWRLL